MAKVPIATKSERPARKREHVASDEISRKLTICLAVATVRRLLPSSESSPRTVPVCLYDSRHRAAISLCSKSPRGSTFIHHNAIKVGLTNTFATRGGDCDHRLNGLQNGLAVFPIDSALVRLYQVLPRENHLSHHLSILSSPSQNSLTVNNDLSSLSKRLFAHQLIV